LQDELGGVSEKAVQLDRLGWNLTVDQVHDGTQQVLQAHHVLGTVVYRSMNLA
jgi:hypothetical protein